MSRNWVVNSSPVILLAKIAQASLLPELCETLVIPAGVAREVQAGEASDPGNLWLAAEGAAYIRGHTPISPAIAAWDLGLGESEVLSWAHLDSGYDAIVDDRGARNCAASLGIAVRGTLGVIVLAKRQGIIRAAAPLFEQLIAAGMRINQAVLQMALRQAGE